MNFDNIIGEVLINLFKFALMIGAYSFSKFYFKGDGEKYNFLRVISMIGQIVAACGFATLICKFNYKTAEFYVFLFMIMLPAIIGMWKALELNSKIRKQKIILNNLEE